MPRRLESESSRLTLIDAPWRHEYFDRPGRRGCFICHAVRQAPSNDRANLLLVRGDKGVIVLNRYPYTVGALMVAPVAHLASIVDIEDSTLLDMLHLLKQGIAILDTALEPKGYNIGINQGKEAGAGLDGHLHMHLVPRWGADTNFMTSIAGARVLAEDTDSMYGRLAKAIQRIEKQERIKSKEKRG